MFTMCCSNPEVLDPIVLEVPVEYGIGITDTLFFGPPAFCGGVGIVDINWLDTHITGTLLPSLKHKVGPDDFPIFLVYNVYFAAPVNNLGSCCILGYHGTTGFPIPTQTYSPAGFSTNMLFSNAAGDTGPFSDTAILSHEVDEWVNDPMVSNPTPPWGNTGQVVGCQANLEVGDPLTGTTVPPGDDAQRLHLPPAGTGVLLLVLRSALKGGERMVFRQRYVPDRCRATLFLGPFRPDGYC